MNERQLMELVRRDAVLHIPGREPAPAKGAYAADYAALLPKMDSRGKYIAGAAAGVVVIAGLAVGIRFLLAPSPVPTPDNSAPVSTAVSTGSEGTADRTDAPGTTSPTSEESTAGTTPPASTEATSQGEGTTAPVTEPTEPVRPPQDKPSKFLPMGGGLYHSFWIMDNGNMYQTRWESTFEKVTDDKRLYYSPQFLESGIAKYVIAGGAEYSESMYMKLYQDGRLMVSGFLPTKDGTRMKYNYNYSAFDDNYKNDFKSFGKQHDEPVLLSEQVADIARGAYLTRDGSVYYYGVKSGYSYATPKKIIENVAMLADDYIITKDGKFYERQDNQLKLLANNVRDADVGEKQYYYITTQGDLFIWGDFYRCDTFIDSPTKVASHVKDATVTNYGYCYLTESNDLYLETYYVEGVGYGKRPANFLDGGKQIASQVEDFYYYIDLLYLTSTNELHEVSQDGYEAGNIRAEDNTRMKSVYSFATDSNWIIATTTNNVFYIWGENILNLHTSGQDVSQIPLVLHEPFELGLLLPSKP